MKNIRYHSGARLNILLLLWCTAFVVTSTNTQTARYNHSSESATLDQEMSPEASRPLLLVKSTSIAEQTLAKLEKLKIDDSVTKHNIVNLRKSIQQKHQQIVQACIQQEEYAVVRRTIDTPALRQFLTSLGNVEGSSYETFIEQKTLARINQTMVQNQMALLEKKFHDEGKELTDSEHKRYVNELADYFQPVAVSYKPAVTQATIAHAVNRLQVYDELITHSLQHQQKATDIPAGVIVENNASNPWFTLALLSLLGLFFGDVMWEKAKDKISLATLFLKNKIDNTKQPVKKKIK